MEVAAEMGVADCLSIVKLRFGSQKESCATNPEIAKARRVMKVEIATDTVSFIGDDLSISRQTRYSEAQVNKGPDYGTKPGKSEAETAPTRWMAALVHDLFGIDT